MPGKKPREPKERVNKRVLFVCLGNICRSPAAEGWFKHIVAKKGLADMIEVDSAGTEATHRGELADGRMQRAASDRGYRLTSRARQLEKRDLDQSDLIIAMDRQNLINIQALRDDIPHRAVIRLLSSFLPETENWPVDVPDPYFGTDSGFDDVLDMIEASETLLLKELISDSDPPSNEPDSG